MTDQDRIRYLEEQVEHLTREKRAVMDAIDLTANLSNFQISLNKIESPLLILRETAVRVRRTLDVNTISFYLVDEADSDFYLAYTDPEEESGNIENEVNALIEDKTFTWALGRTKPVIVSAADKKRQVLLHSMSTSSRVRGIFVGILATQREEITDLSLFLFSITMVACSTALESFELYRQIRERNQRLRDNVQQLEEKEEKYRALFEQAANSIILYDPLTRKPVEFNDLACLNLGYTREEFKDLCIEEYELEAEEEDIRTQVHEILRKAQITYESCHRRKDGEIRNVIVSSRPISFRGKTYVLSLVTDITRQKENEKEQLRLEKRLRQAHKLESIGTLAGGIAHDFNNILAIILGYAELSLLDLPLDNNTVRGNLDQLIKAVARAKKLVMQILTFSRQGDEVQTPIEINPVISESLALLRSTLPTTIEIRRNIELNPLFIVGDSTQVHQILMNLCTNAAQAIGMKSGHIGVRLTSVQFSGEGDVHPSYKNILPGQYVQLEVEDNGEGMNTDVLERVFDPYFTTKQPGEGTGLGLAVVHGIVEKYGGHIAIRSTPGQGTVVTVRIPQIHSGGEEIEEEEERDTIIFENNLKK
jgi:PAS domain S-box-containing protein